MKPVKCVAAILVLGVCAAGPAAAQSWNASVARLKPAAKGKQAEMTFSPWFAAKPGDTFAILPVAGAPVARLDGTAVRVKAQTRHCFASNVHEITLSIADGMAARKIRPVGKYKDGSPEWPQAIVISPAAPKARLMPLSRVGAPDMPKGQNKANLIAAVDISGNGFADVVLLKTCSGYEMKPEKSQAQLDAMDHRQCPANVPVFHHLYLRSRGQWKQVWYEDLC